MRQPNAHGAYLRFLLVLTLLAAIPLGAQAEVSDLWVTSSANEHMEDAVHGYYRSGAWYLFLPAHMQPDALALWFEGADALTLQDGRKLENGRRTDWMAAGGEYTLTYGKKQIRLFVMQSADLPALFATTASGSLEYIHQTKEHEETGSLYMVTPDGKVVYQDELKQIKGRGNATFQYAKKSYQIKLADKTALCGTDKAKTWVLLANQHDNSLLRNQLSFALSNAVGLRFTPDCQPVDLYINGDYLGSYLLCEKVQVAKGRVEIADLEEANEERNAAKPESHEAFGKKYYKEGTSKGVELPVEPEDVTGGYLLELEYSVRYSSEASGFVTKKGQPVVVKAPEYAGREEINYISGLVQSFENALFSKTGTDSATGKHYSEIIDMDSFARKYILEELSKNYDANKSSQFFYKDLDAVSSLIYAGPVWDYDSAYGNYGGSEASPTLKPRGLFVATNRSYSYSWYPELCEKEDFMTLVRKLWQEDYLPVLRTMLLGTGEREGVMTIAEMAKPLRKSADMNFTRWRIFNYKGRAAKTGATYQENLDYLQTFLTKRTAYLCELWGGSFDAQDGAAK